MLRSIPFHLNIHLSYINAFLRLYGTGGTGRIFERLSVQVWDLKKAVPKRAHLAVQNPSAGGTVQVFVRAKICPDQCKRGLRYASKTPLLPGCIASRKTRGRLFAWIPVRMISDIVFCSDWLVKRYDGDCAWVGLELGKVCNEPFARSGHMVRNKLHWGPVHTYTDIFESATFLLRIQKFLRPHVAYSNRIRPFTRIRWYPDSL